MVSSDYIDGDSVHCDKTCWAIQLHVEVARVQDTDKFVDQRLGCHSRVTVSTLPRAPSLCSLFFAWLCFSLAFSTVLQAFLTNFLVDSGNETTIQNMDELFASDIKLEYPALHNINLLGTENWRLQIGKKSFRLRIIGVFFELSKL